MTKLAHNKAKFGWDAFNKSYEVQELPWFTREIDSDFREFIEKYGSRGKRILDVGAGPGTTAVFLARSGYEVTATDISPYIVEVAKKRAGALASAIEWRVDDITESKLSGEFDVIHDRGCFHVLPEDLRIKYVGNICRLIAENGVLCMKAFSKNEETPRPGAHKFDAKEISEYFRCTFKLLESRESSLPSTLENDPRAIFVILKKST